MPFISFSYLIMLSTTTDTMLLNRSDESGHPHSFQILKKKSFYFWTTVLFSAVWTKCKYVFSYQQWPLHSQALCRPVFETHPALLSPWSPSGQGGTPTSFESPPSSNSGLSPCSQYRLLLSPLFYLKGQTDSPGQNLNSDLSKSQGEWNSETAHPWCCSHAHDAFSYFHLFNLYYRQVLEI